MKRILLKLAEGKNEFECTVFGQKRICKILQLDLSLLNEDKGSALVRLNEPVKKIERRQVEASSVWGMDREDSLPFEDVEVNTNEEWISIN